MKKTEKAQLTASFRRSHAVWDKTLGTDDHEESLRALIDDPDLGGWAARELAYELYSPSMDRITRRMEEDFFGKTPSLIPPTPKETIAESMALAERAVDVSLATHDPLLTVSANVKVVTDAVALGDLARARAAWLAARDTLNASPFLSGLDKKWGQLAHARLHLLSATGQLTVSDADAVILDEIGGDWDDARSMHRGYVEAWFHRRWLRPLSVACREVLPSMRGQRVTVEHVEQFLGINLSDEELASLNVPSRVEALVRSGDISRRHFREQEGSDLVIGYRLTHRGFHNMRAAIRADLPQLDLSKTVGG